MKAGQRLTAAGPRRAAGCSVLRGSIAVVCLCLSLAVAASPVPAADYVRLYGEIADTVEKHFYDAGFVRERFGAIRTRYAEELVSIRSQTQFRELVNRMLSDLRSSHTRYYTPDESAYYQLLSIFREHPNVRPLLGGKAVRYPGIGLETERRGEKVFVVAVFEGGVAEKAGVLKGDEILSLDGRPFEEVASLRDAVGRTVKLSLRRRVEAAPLTLEVVPAMVDPKEEYLAAAKASVRLFSRGRKTIGYIHLLSYAGEEFNEKFLEALADPLREADALVWDLRDGWGGADPRYLSVFAKNVPVLSFRGRDEGTAFTYDPQWRKPVAMLVNGRVRSGKEIMAFGFKKYGTGVVIGECTAGAVLGGTPFVLSDGTLLYLAVNGVEVDGEVLEGNGVEPDIAVPMPVEYLEGKDPQLQRALEHLERQ